MAQKEKYISISRAMEMAKKMGVTFTRPTVIKHVKQRELGYQIGGKGGRWIVIEKEWKKFLNG